MSLPSLLQGTKAPGAMPTTPDYTAANGGFYMDKSFQSPDTEFAGYRILNDLLGLWRGQVGNAYGMQGANQGARMNALQSLNPGNMSAISDEYRSNATRSARDRGRMLGSMLRGKGYGQNAEDAAQLGAMNDAAQASSENDSQLYSPGAQFQRAMQAMGLTDPTQIMSLLQVFPGLDQMIQGERQVNDQAHASSGGGILGQLLGQGLGMLGGGGLGNILSMFGGGGRGGGQSSPNPLFGALGGASL